MVRWLIQPPQGLPRRSFGVSVVNAAREPVHFLGAGGAMAAILPADFLIRAPRRV
jgi:hypothetical protein